MLFVLLSSVLGFLEIMAIPFFFLQFSRIDKIRLTTAKKIVNFIYLVAKFFLSTLYAHSINSNGQIKSSNAASPIPPEIIREINIDAVRHNSAIFVYDEGLSSYLLILFSALSAFAVVG